MSVVEVPGGVWIERGSNPGIFCPTGSLRTRAGLRMVRVLERRKDQPRTSPHTERVVPGTRPVGASRVDPRLAPGRGHGWTRCEPFIEGRDIPDHSRSPHRTLHRQGDGVAGPQIGPTANRTSGLGSGRRSVARGRSLAGGQGGVRADRRRSRPRWWMDRPA